MPNCIGDFMNTQEKKTKSALSEKIWARIKAILQERHISQIELTRLCEEHGYKVSQPEISKLYSGKLQLTLYQLSAFSEVLGISTDYLINEKEIYRRFQVTGQSLVVQPSDDIFHGYLGSYYTMIHSTSPFEDKVLYGKISFSPSKKGDVCEAYFELNTGERDTKGKPIIKIYRGQLIISKKMSVAYCILANEEIGEICMIEFRHRSFVIRKAECRVGLALSASSGESKVPVVQKILLSRYPITEEIQQKILPFLKIESEDVLIRTGDLLALAEKNKLNFNFSALADECEADEYLLIDEKAIRKVNRKLNRYEMAEIMCLIKEASSGEYLVTVSEQDDGSAFNVIEHEVRKLSPEPAYIIKKGKGKSDDFRNG